MSKATMSWVFQRGSGKSDVTRSLSQNEEGCDLEAASENLG